MRAASSRSDRQSLRRAGYRLKLSRTRRSAQSTAPRTESAVSRARWRSTTPGARALWFAVRALLWCYLRVTGLSWAALVPRARDVGVYATLGRQLFDTRPAR